MLQLQQAHKIDLCPALSPQEQDIIVSRQSPMIKNMGEPDIANEMLKIILKTYFDCGQNANQKTVVLEIQDLMSDLTKYFGTVCIEEIKLFFKSGIDGEFGEYFGLNNKTYRQWLRGGVSSAKRSNARKIQDMYLQEKNKPKPLTESEKEKIIKDGVLKAFEEYKSKGWISDIGNVSYNWLDRNGHIKFTRERKTGIKSAARGVVSEQLSNELESAKLSINKLEVKRIQFDLENLENKEDRVKAEAKRIAINLFFKELIDIGTELTDIINQTTL